MHGAGRPTKSCIKTKSRRQHSIQQCANHKWAVPRYFLGTGTGTVGTFVVPVPRYFGIFWRYRYFSFVLFFSRDFTNVIKNLKRCKMLANKPNKQRIFFS